MSTRIDYERVAEVDMADLRDLNEKEISEHFANIAALATSAQLRTFLTGMPFSEDAIDDEDADERQELEIAYVRRRVETVQRLRDGAALFESALAFLDEASDQSSKDRSSE